MARFIIVTIIIGIVIFLSSWFFGRNTVQSPQGQQSVQEQEATITQGDDVEDIEKDIIFLENDFNNLEVEGDAELKELDSLIQVN